MNDDSYKRETTPEATVSRGLTRDGFAKACIDDEMALLVEIWESKDFPGVDLYVQYRPALRETGDGSYNIDHAFVLLGNGPSGPLPREGVRIPGNPERAMNGGESLVAYAMMHESVRDVVRCACPDFVAEFDRRLLDIAAELGSGARRPRI